MKQKTSVKALVGFIMMEVGTFATIVLVCVGVVLHILTLKNWEPEEKHWSVGALMIWYAVIFVGAGLTK